VDGLEIMDAGSLREAESLLGLPYIVTSLDELSSHRKIISAAEEISFFDISADLHLYAEKFVAINKVISVPTVRTEFGTVICFDPVECIYSEAGCVGTISPPELSAPILDEAKLLSRKAIESLPLSAVGVFTVKLFLQGNGVFVVKKIYCRWTHCML
jgi:phosphoribosylaminoimidazole carboxylase (NCAIR synthetase)